MGTYSAQRQDIGLYIHQLVIFGDFESDYYTAYRINGFLDVWLEKTYATASIGNKTMVIEAGIVAQLLEDK